MKVTLPNLGNLTPIAGKALFSNLGHEVVLPPPNTKRTLDLGVRYAPEYCCLPLKIVLGNFIEGLEKGADTIIMAGGWGPCRFGYYAEIQRMILKSLGYKFEMISFEVPHGNLIRMLDYANRLRNGKSLSAFVNAFKIAWSKIVAIEELEKKALKARPRENTRGETSRVLGRGLSLIDNANSVRKVEKIKAETLSEYDRVVKGNEDKADIKIRLLGEFYVALEPFVNHHIEEKLGDLGVEVERGVSLMPWIYSLSKFFKMKDDEALQVMIQKAAKPYLALSVGGEGQSTVGQIVLASERGMDGAIQVVPFTCMPEIVAETISKRVSDDLSFPVLTLIYDEQTGEEGLITRLDAFVDLLRMKKNKRHLVKI